MAAATWTDPADRADGYVVGQTVWNQLIGDTGNLQFLYENSMIPAAVSTSAQTTTSTSATDLLTLTPTESIGINDWAMVYFEFRKTATNPNAVAFGLKVNSTTVLEAVNSAGKPRSSATNQAEAGFCRFLIPPRSSANYGFGVIHEFACFTTAGAYTASTLTDTAAASGPTNMSAALPNAAITSVTIRAINHAANNNAEVRNAALYRIRNQ